MASADSDRAFSIGRVVSRTFGSIGRNALSYFLLALIASVPSAFFTWYLQNRVAAAGDARALAFSGSYWLTLAGSWLLALVLGRFLQAALVHTTIRDLNGQPVSIGDALSTALGLIVPVVGVTIVASFAIGFAMFLLIVPGLMLACAWIVVVPVLVVERAGVFGSLTRSGELTKGHRWPIFGILVVYWVGLIAANIAAGPFFGVSLMGPRAAGVPPTYLLFLIIYGAVVYTISAAGTANIYYELRSVKEGIGPQQLASVFE